MWRKADTFKTFGGKGSYKNKSFIGLFVYKSVRKWRNEEIIWKENVVIWREKTYKTHKKHTKWMFESKTIGSESGTLSRPWKWVWGRARMMEWSEGAMSNGLPSVLQPGFMPVNVRAPRYTSSIPAFTCVCNACVQSVLRTPSFNCTLMGDLRAV